MMSPRKPGGDPGDSIKIGLTVTNDPKISGGIKVSVVSLDLSGERRSTTGNTLTVNFYQAGTYFVKPAKNPAQESSNSQPSMVAADKVLRHVVNGSLTTLGGNPLLHFVADIRRVQSQRPDAAKSASSTGQTDVGTSTATANPCVKDLDSYECKIHIGISRVPQ